MGERGYRKGRERDKKRFSVGERKIGRETGVVEREKKERQEWERKRKPLRVNHR